MKYSVVWLCGLAIWLLMSCDWWQQHEKGELLAEVYDNKLYVADIQPFLPQDATEEDSLLFISTYVERWAKEAIMLHEAEKNWSEEINIDALVENYRASLIRQHYEEQLIENELIKKIDEEELREFYEKNKAQYELEAPIVRALLIKLPRSVGKPSEFNRWWDNAQSDSSSFNQLKAFVQLHSEEVYLSDSIWYDLKEINTILPEGSITEDNVRTKREFTQRDDDYEYFYRNLEVINKRAIAPFEYIEAQASRFILQQRKNELLQERRKELYETETNNGRIQLYVEN
jgi:DNA-binding transcriptional ArsR family regulator